ncbi:hypothetical protein [Streptomyces sp. NPDC048392]|uniref:hypothetical protein n=1 Tax=Streptomyces sp. NPDC048392 TaxID=3365543 RepID=UPI0037100A21
MATARVIDVDVVDIRFPTSRYVAPTAPGFSSQPHADSIAAHRCPDGVFRAADLAQRRKGTNR